MIIALALRPGAVFAPNLHKSLVSQKSSIWNEGKRKKKKEKEKKKGKRNLQEI